MKPDFPTSYHLQPTTVLLLFGFAAIGSAQIVAPGPSGVSMGHVHLNTKDPGAQKKFWVDVIGAEETKLGTMPAFKMPGVLILVRKADPSGGTEGSVVNHIAVKVRDLSETLAKVEAAQIQVVSKNPPQAMLLGPDDVRVELTEDKTLAQPAVFHHIHFYTAQVDEMKKWYRKVPALGIAIAFLTDPFGTYIELTEGLDKI